MENPDICCDRLTLGSDYEDDDDLRKNISTMKMGRFKKSESEDSGVELPPGSPLGSESSYSIGEPDSLENHVYEEPECFKSFVHENTNVLPDITSDQMDLQALPKSRNPVLNYCPMTELDISEEQETDKSDISHRVEQAMQRSRMRRARHRDPHHCRSALYGQRYPGSLKTTYCNREKSPSRAALEKEEDGLSFPGEGLRYLESLCLMMEHLAELQQRNRALLREKKETEQKVRNRVLGNSCTCGSSKSHNPLVEDSTDSRLPDTGTWEDRQYRRRSSSHTGALRRVDRNTSHALVLANKTNPRFVSVPNLQEEVRQSRTQSFKGETSHWFKLKDLVSKLTNKATGSTAVQGSIGAEKQRSCRYQANLESSSIHPQRLFLPGLVIRPRK
ncbi:hypothetical protein GDO86_006758 [Hymenochirus boettgeri]|uniref:DUF4657 domain-containing protein n=1 Tax=Hymenochirus boettgeri TaxID=247094 RepID=A0A8T2JEW9_9PIPI|nr:hypothetical protein GDO86_006758 [Hymenochirus boettgeri]